MQTILLVDDDPDLREVVRFALEASSYRVLEAGDGDTALELSAAHAPDLVVLDVMMPGLDGREVCQRIRARSATPILFLSSRASEMDRVIGLEIGGDDYMTKPFSPRELVARVRALLRRVGRTDVGDSPSRVRQGHLLIDVERVEVRWRDELIPLTATELALLVTLARAPGRVYRRRELMDHVYGHGTVVADRTINSHIKGLRQKLAEAGAEPIETVRGFGYRFVEPES